MKVSDNKVLFRKYDIQLKKTFVWIDLTSLTYFVTKHKPPVDNIMKFTWEINDTVETKKTFYLFLILPKMLKFVKK